MTAVVAAPVAQLLDGLQLQATAIDPHCTACGRAFRIADRIHVHAHRPVERSEWALPRLYCRDCPVELPSTLGTVEVLAAARLGAVAIPTGRDSRLCLTDITVLDQQSGHEG
jgi:hypothetical protein